MRMLAPSIGDRAADERHDRQGQPRRLVRPQKRLLEEAARHDIGQHERELEEQRGDDERFGQPVRNAQREAVLPRRGDAVLRSRAVRHVGRHDGPFSAA